MRYLKRDSRAGEIAFDIEKANFLALQTRLDSIAKEHGGGEQRFYKVNLRGVCQESLLKR